MGGWFCWNPFFGGRWLWFLVSTFGWCWMVGKMFCFLLDVSLIGFVRVVISLGPLTWPSFLPVDLEQDGPCEVRAHSNDYDWNLFWNMDTDTHINMKIVDTRCVVCNLVQTCTQSGCLNCAKYVHKLHKCIMKRRIHYCLMKDTDWCHMDYLMPSSVSRRESQKHDWNSVG